MNSPNVRIFVTTSHISTVFMTMLARSTWMEGTNDILLVDTGTRRNELLELIMETASLHDWALIKSFSSEVGSEHDFKPSLRKKITRKIKSLPVVKPIYDSALKGYMTKRDEEFISELSALLSKWTKFVNAELFLMTQTYLNRPLRKLFPSAPIHYMEHGIGDYYYILENETPKGDLYAVFERPYRKYLESIGRHDIKVSPIPVLNEFPDLALKLMEIHSRTIDSEALPTTDKPVIYVLLEAVDMYHVRESFWTAYIDHILKEIDNPKKYHFILKLHPMHSKHSLEKTEHYFRKSGLEFSVLGNEVLSSLSAEVLFSKYASQTHSVFCLFSSGCFYLSQLYRDLGIKFYYSTDFFMNYIENAPPQYHKLYVEIKPILDRVMAENCTPY